MRKLNKVQLAVYNIGGVLLFLGALVPIVTGYGAYAPFIFTPGALMFGFMQLLQRYEGRSIVLRRLRRQQMLGALALMLSGGMMFFSRYGLEPFSGSEWQMALAIGALLEVYTAFRIPSELKKEQQGRG